MVAKGGECIGQLLLGNKQSSDLRGAHIFRSLGLSLTTSRGPGCRGRGKERRVILSTANALIQTVCADQ